MGRGGTHRASERLLHRWGGRHLPCSEEDPQTEFSAQHISARVTPPGSKQDWITGLCQHLGILKITWEKIVPGEEQAIKQTAKTLVHFVGIQVTASSFYAGKTWEMQCRQKKAGFIWKWFQRYRNGKQECFLLKQKHKDTVKIKKGLGLWGRQFSNRNCLPCGKLK